MNYNENKLECTYMIIQFEQGKFYHVKSKYITSPVQRQRYAKIRKVTRTFLRLFHQLFIENLRQEKSLCSLLTHFLVNIQ